MVLTLRPPRGPPRSDSFMVHTAYRVPALQGCKECPPTVTSMSDIEYLWPSHLQSSIGPHPQVHVVPRGDKLKKQWTPADE